jgi:hypothetical protein
MSSSAAAVRLACSTPSGHGAIPSNGCGHMPAGLTLRAQHRRTCTLDHWQTFHRTKLQTTTPLRERHSCQAATSEPVRIAERRPNCLPLAPVAPYNQQTRCTGALIKQSSKLYTSYSLNVG